MTTGKSCCMLTSKVVRDSLIYVFVTQFILGRSTKAKILHKETFKKL